MVIEEIAPRELREMVAAGRVSQVVAVGLPGAWAVSVISSDCSGAGMTVLAPEVDHTLHARYWSSLPELDDFLDDTGVVTYSVDRRFYTRDLPVEARNAEYFPAGPVEYLDHEFAAYVRRTTQAR